MTDLRETMIRLWGDWAVNGWSRPDDDLRSELELTPEEEKRGIAHGQELKRNLERESANA